MARLTFQRYLYTPQGATLLEPRQIRREYSRLRNIAIKRLTRLGQSEFSDTQVYLENVGGFPKLSEIPNNVSLRHEFSRLARFIESPRSSVRGQQDIRRRAISTLRSQGYTQINNANFRLFTDFMGAVRAAGIGSTYDSDSELDFFENTMQESAEGAVPDLDSLLGEWQSHVANRPRRVRNRDRRGSDRYR